MFLKTIAKSYFPEIFVDVETAKINLREIHGKAQIA